MTDAASNLSSDITPEDVLSFLKDNPDFLAKTPEAIELLIPPTQDDGRKVKDFQSYMIERLKNDKAEVVKTAQEIVETSRANMNNQSRIHAAVLRLLEAETFEDFIHTITMDLSAMLDVDIATLVVEADGEAIPHINNTGIRLLPPSTIANWMGGKSALLQSDISGIEPIYGGGATLVRSQILLRVDISGNTPPALLAFGSRDPDMFAEGQATDQILFLTRVIERAFRAWLALPQ